MVADAKCEACNLNKTRESRVSSRTTTIWTIIDIELPRLFSGPLLLLSTRSSHAAVKMVPRFASGVGQQRYFSEDRESAKSVGILESDAHFKTRAQIIIVARAMPGYTLDPEASPPEKYLALLACKATEKSGLAPTATGLPKHAVLAIGPPATTSCVPSVASFRRLHHRGRCHVRGSYIAAARRRHAGEDGHNHKS